MISHSSPMDYKFYRPINRLAMVNFYSGNRGETLVMLPVLINQTRLIRPLTDLDVDINITKIRWYVTRHGWNTTLYRRINWRGLGDLYCGHRAQTLPLLPMLINQTRSIRPLSDLQVDVNIMAIVRYFTGHGWNRPITRYTPIRQNNNKRLKRLASAVPLI